MAQVYDSIQLAHVAEALEDMDGSQRTARWAGTHEATALEFAREWIADCGWADDVDARLLTDAQVRRGVERHYDGGWRALMYDALL